MNVIEDNHAKRMSVILKKDEEFLANMISYISGYMGDDPLFQVAFEDALENTIVLR